MAVWHYTASCIRTRYFDWCQKASVKEITSKDYTLDILIHWRDFLKLFLVYDERDFYLVLHSWCISIRSLFSSFWEESVKLHFETGLISCSLSDSEKCYILFVFAVFNWEVEHRVGGKTLYRCTHPEPLSPLGLWVEMEAVQCNEPPDVASLHFQWNSEVRITEKSSGFLDILLT